MKRFRDIIQDIKAASSGKVIIGCIEGDFNHTIYMNLTLITYDGSSINFAGITELLLNSSVINSLNSPSTTAPLSANQGRILNEKIVKLESKSNVAVLTPTGTKLMELISSSPNVTQEQLVEAGFTPEICRRLNAGEVIYMSGECAGFGNDALLQLRSNPQVSTL